MEILSDISYRKKFINSFINVDKKHYKDYLIAGYNGLYIGYLWDCFKYPEVVNETQIKKQIKKLDKIYVIGDLNVNGRKKFDRNIYDFVDIIFPLDFVVLISGEDFLINENLFPEDIYIFDDTFTWTYALTHEYINEERFCLSTKP